MRVKYNRVSTINQTGNRFSIDDKNYDLILFDKVSGTVPFFQRKEGSKIMELVLKNEITELTVEDFSRLGRNTGDIISTLEFLDSNKVNVFIRNIGIYSRPNGEKNPIWRMISSVMSSMYEMELDNIKERTRIGQLVYLKNGGRLGRPVGTKLNDNEFLKKQKSRKILNYLKKDYTIREISSICGVSSGLVVKVKKISEKISK